MDINGINFHLFTGSDSVNLENMTAVEDDWNTLFINYAAIAWHEMRRAWIGDQSVASQRKPRESIIRWSSSKPDLLSSNEAFDGPVPLSKMVGFLVQVWEGDVKE
ncbi:hypothetical protein ACS0TY_015850 [Phlomoides rotata]